MNVALIKKCFAETGILFVAIAMGVFSFAWFRVWVVSELDTSQFTQIIELLPEDWRNFTSVEFEWLVSYLGRTALTLDEPFLVMLLAIFAIVRGTDVVSGEISRGTMEMLLSQPVSRRQVFWTPVVFTLIGVLLLSLLVWAAMYLGVQTTSISESVYPIIRIPFFDYEIPLTFLNPKTETLLMSERVNSVYFLPGIANLFTMGFFLVGVATLISSFDRYRWRTLGLAVGFYMVSAMLKILSMSSGLFSWLKYVTFFSLYEPESFIQQAEERWSSQLSLLRYDDSGNLLELGPLGYNLTFLLLGTISLVIAARIFHRRDIPAPL